MEPSRPTGYTPPRCHSPYGERVRFPLRLSCRPLGVGRDRLSTQSCRLLSVPLLVLGLGPMLVDPLAANRAEVPSVITSVTEGTEQRHREPEDD